MKKVAALAAAALFAAGLAITTASAAFESQPGSVAFSESAISLAKGPGGPGPSHKGGPAKRDNKRNDKRRDNRNERRHDRRDDRRHDNRNDRRGPQGGPQNGPGGPGAPAPRMSFLDESLVSMAAPPPAPGKDAKPAPGKEAKPAPGKEAKPAPAPAPGKPAPRMSFLDESLVSMAAPPAPGKEAKPAPGKEAKPAPGKEAKPAPGQKPAPRTAIIADDVTLTQAAELAKKPKHRKDPPPPPPPPPRRAPPPPPPGPRMAEVNDSLTALFGDVTFTQDVTMLAKKPKDPPPPPAPKPAPKPEPKPAPAPAPAPKPGPRLANL